MKTKTDRDLEELLASCRLTAAPPGLRDKILRAARGEDVAYLRWRTRLKLCLVLCPILLILLFAADAMLSRSEQFQRQALLDGRGTTPAHPGDEMLDWSGLSGDEIDSRMIIGRRATSVQPENFIGSRRELIRMLNEEFEDHENSKSLD